MNESEDADCERSIACLLITVRITIHRVYVTLLYVMFYFLSCLWFYITLVMYYYSVIVTKMIKKQKIKALLHHLSIKLLMCVAVILLQNKTSIFGNKLNVDFNY